MEIKCSDAFLNYEGCVIYTFNTGVSCKYSLKTIQLDLLNLFSIVALSHSAVLEG